MGKVVEHEVASTLLQLKIQDNSSQTIFSVQYYVKGKQDQNITENVTEGAIFSCFGAIRTYKSNPGAPPYLNMFAGSAVTNEAEYRAHELSTRYTSLYNAKGPLRDLGKSKYRETDYFIIMFLVFYYDSDIFFIYIYPPSSLSLSLS